MKFVAPLIKITDSCNFNCQFCYYAQKQNNDNMSKKIMPIELLKKIIFEICEINTENGNNICHLIFHGGEPMLAGIDYFKEVMLYEDELKEKFPEIKFQNSIQTNGILINEEWADFFKEYDFGVSVSIDGDKELNFHKLRKDFFDSDEVVLNKLKLLIERDVVLTVMSVITDEHIGKEKRLYDFYRKNEIHNVAFCFCFNKDSDDSVNPIKLGEFLKNFFDLYYYGDYDLNVRDFESIFCKLVGKTNGLCLYSDRNDCGDFPTIDSAGNVYFCDIATEKDKSLANLNECSLKDIFETSNFKEQKRLSQKILSDSCLSCEMKDYCGKICYRTDIIDANGKVKNYFCDTYKMIIEHVKDIISKDIDL